MLMTMTPEIIDRLKYIQQELKTQDNRYTADPIFLVQEKERIWGMDSEYVDDYVWYNTEDQCEADEEEAKEFDRLDDEIENIPSAWSKCWYFDKWIAVQSFFTEKAAQDYIDSQYYRHRGELRIYADSLYRNDEMKFIRDYLLTTEF
jgi:hypothetical protein